MYNCAVSTQMRCTMLNQRREDRKPRWIEEEIHLMRFKGMLYKVLKKSGYGLIAQIG